MYFYEVYVAHKKATKPLTYSSSKQYPIGEIVKIPFGSSHALGFITSEEVNPGVETKVLESAGLAHQLPKPQLGLVTWIMSYYPASVGQITSLFLPSMLVPPGLVKPKKESKALPTTFAPKLLRQQKTAIQTITASKKHSFLLHGITGSGKTRIYVELAKNAAKEGRSTIILSPEIGMTAQLVETISSSLPGLTVRLIHSQMSTKKKSQIWQEILSSQKPQIVIGPRSALFMPLPKIGYIIIDEAHDSAYKNNSQPYYQTNQVGAQLAFLNKAKLVMGSATPPISDYFVFKSRGLPIIELIEPAKKKLTTQKTVQIVDIKDRQQFTKSPWLSELLLTEIRKQLDKKQQSLLFLNRRGTAKVTMCSACAWQALCPACDTPLTFHGDTYSLLCHTCNFKQRVPSSCPVCHRIDLVFKSVGTKFIVDELSRLFSSARIMRFDSDIPRSQQLERQYQKVAEGGVDILVGTQLLTKGWDLPKLGLVGIVTADSGLFFPDYTAEETTYQLIHQVIGRVHRGHLPGVAIVQTYQPSSQTIQNATQGDYTTFYKSQLVERQQFNYPPYVFVMKLWAKRVKRESIRSASQKLAEKLRDQNRGSVEVLGPSPAFQERIRGMYSWQIIVKSKDRARLTKIVHTLPSGWSYDIDPVHLL